MTIVIRCKASYILASKQWEIRKLCEPQACSNPSISQDHAKLQYILISKSIHTLIENDPSTLVAALILHIKSTERYITTYGKTWFHHLLRLLQAMQQFLLVMVAKKETLPMPPQGSQTVKCFVKLHCPFWSSRSCIDGFQYCKPVVQVDGTWLNDKYKEALLMKVDKMTTIKSFQ